MSRVDYSREVAVNDCLACSMTPSSRRAWHRSRLYPHRLVRIYTECSPTSGWILLLQAGVSDSCGAAFGMFLLSAVTSKAARWVLWGCCTASSVVSTGVTQASTSSKIWHHSSWVLLAKIFVNWSRSADQSWNCGASSALRPRPKTMSCGNL